MNALALPGEAVTTYLCCCTLLNCTMPPPLLLLSPLARTDTVLGEATETVEVDAAPGSAAT